MDDHPLVVGLAALVATFAVVACSTVGPGSSSRGRSSRVAQSGLQIAAWKPCHDAGVQRSGRLDAFRMGAIDFSSRTTGVGLTAGSYQCYRRIRGGVSSSDRAVPEQLATTSDGGRSWMRSGVPLPGSASTGGSYRELIVRHGRSVWAVSSEGRPFLTTDQGRTWQPVSLPQPVIGLAARGGYVWALSCPRHRAVGCTPELSRKPLKSGSWSTLALPRRNSLETAWALLPGGNAVVSVGRGMTEGALLISSRAGTRWRTRPAPRPRWGRQPCEVAYLAAYGRRIWLLCVGGAAAGSSAKALLESTDGGASWRVRSSIASLDTPHKPAALSTLEPSALAAGSSSRLWLALTFGMSISNDAGRRWPLNTSVNTQGESTTAFDVLSATHAWLIAPGAGLWRTTNGTHWSALGPLNTG